MVYLSSYIDGHKDVDTLNGFSNDTLDYFKEIYENYITLTGYDGFNEDTSNKYFWAELDIPLTSSDPDSIDAVLLVDYWVDQTSPTIHDLTWSISGDEDESPVDSISS